MIELVYNYITVKCKNVPGAIKKSLSAYMEER